MQRLHRSTIWRRKRKKLLGIKKSKLGRKRKSEYLQGAYLVEAAQIVARHSGYHGVTLLEPYNYLDASGLAPIAVFLAAWDECKPVQRTRSKNRPIWDFRPGSRGYRQRVLSAAKKLKGRYEAEGHPFDLETAKKIIEEAVAERADWLPAALGAERGSLFFEPAGRACPSSHAEISRRMVSYWRKHNDYSAAVSLIRRFRSREGA